MRTFSDLLATARSIWAKSGDEGGHSLICHMLALFDGLIEGIDPERLRLAVRSGLGHAKALGLGLLSLGRTA